MSRYPLEELKALERSAEPAWLWDPDRARVVWANRAGVAFWGEPTMLDLIDRRFDASDPTARRLSAIAREAGEADGSPETLVARTADGPAALEAHCRRVVLEDGRRGVLVQGRPSAAEAHSGATRASLLQTAVAELPTPLLVIDRHGSVVFENAAALSILARPEKGAGQSLFGFWLGDSDRAEALISHVLTHGSASEAVTLRTRLGERAHRLNMKRIAAPVVGRMALLVTAEDVEDHRRHEVRRNETIESSHAILGAADAVFRLDSEGHLVELVAITEAFGTGTGVLIGSDFDDLLAALEIDPGRPVADRVVEARSWRELLPATGPDGNDGRLSCLVSATAQRGRDGRLEGFAGLLVLVEAGRGQVAAGFDEIDLLDDDTAGGDPSRDMVSSLQEQPEPAADTAEPEAAETEMAEPEMAEPEAEEPESPEAAPEASPGAGGGPAARGHVGRDDAATFSAIARALGITRTGPDAAPKEHHASGATLRVVGGVDAARRQGVAPAEAPGETEAEQPEAQAEPVWDLAAGDRPTLVHRHFNILDANEKLAALFGHASRDQLLEDRNLLNLMPDERGRLFSLQSRFDDRNIPATGRIEGVSLRARRPDRSSIDLSASFQEVEFGGETAIRIEFSPEPPVSEDKAAPEPSTPAAAHGPEAEPPPATDRNEALSAAVARETELRAVINTAADGIVTIGGDGRVLTLNASAEAIFGTEAVKVAGREFSSMFTSESARTIDSYLRSAAGNDSTRLHREGHEVHARRGDGSDVPLFVTIGRMNVQDGTRYCAVIRDISAWKETEEGLRLAKQRAEEDSSKKSDFLARISHELRTPLNAIIGFSEVMSEEKFGPIANDRYKGYLADIRSSGGHLLSLINDLLDLSKIEAGQLELNFTSVDVSRVVEQAVAIIQPQANRARVIVRVSLPEQLPPVVADERSLRQIMLNLLSNAVKFTPPGGQVILSAVVDEQGRLQVRVRDTGVGMTRDEISRAMEPFRQIEGASQQDYAGTGLGLPLTKALTEANRAEFTIESTPQAGTLVHITFPTNRVLDG